MKVLVIGGAGYIGSHVVKELMKNGHKVTVFDNLSSGLHENLFEGNGFIQGDILNTKDLDNVFKNNYDACIHLAAFKDPGDSMKNPERYSVNNISGTINIINAMCKYNCKNIVFSSSAAIFGNPEYDYIDENHSKNPINYYGFTKLEIERILDWYSTLKGINFACLRYFNAAGYNIDGFPNGLERNPANLIPIIMEVAIGKRESMQIYGNDYDTRDGTCIRDYIHVDDLATAHSLALSWINDNNKSIKLNLGTKNGTTVKEIIDSVESIIGKKINYSYGPRRDGDPAILMADSSYAKSLLGWEPKHSDIHTIIETTWKAYKESSVKTSSLNT